MESILDQIKKIIGYQETLKTVLAGSGLLALLSLITLQIPLFLLFVFIALMSFIKIQRNE